MTGVIASGQDAAPDVGGCFCSIDLTLGLIRLGCDWSVFSGHLLCAMFMDYAMFWEGEIPFDSELCVAKLKFMIMFLYSAVPRTPLNTRQDCDAVDLVAPHGFGFVSELVSLTRPCRGAITQCTASVSGSSAHQLFRPRCQPFSDDPESLANNCPQCSRRNPRPHYGGTRTAVSAEDLKEAVMSKT